MNVQNAGHSVTAAETSTILILGKAAHVLTIANLNVLDTASIAKIRAAYVERLLSRMTTMSKINNLIREIYRLQTGAGMVMMSSLRWHSIKEKYATKPSARIPAKRAQPRVKRDYAPRPKPEAVKVFPDGREVCLNDGKHATTEGLLEYNRRRLVMARRQDWHFADCYWQMLEAGGFTTSATFDHEAKRGTMRDDRVWKEDGTPQNAALCWNCNAARGSIRTPYKFQTKLTRDEWEARKDGSR
jgi:hypothetical protein